MALRCIPLNSRGPETIHAGGSEPRFRVRGIAVAADDQMRILLCDRGHVLADFQHLVRAAHPDAEVDIETDGYRAVELAYARQPTVVVTEIDLAGIAGVELIRRFREAVPRTRVLV